MPLRPADVDPKSWSAARFEQVGVPRLVPSTKMSTSRCKVPRVAASPLLLLPPDGGVSMRLRGGVSTRLFRLPTRAP